MWLLVQITTSTNKVVMSEGRKYVFCSQIAVSFDESCFEGTVIFFCLIDSAPVIRLHPPPSSCAHGWFNKDEWNADSRSLPSPGSKDALGGECASKWCMKNYFLLCQSPAVQKNSPFVCKCIEVFLRGVNRSTLRRGCSTCILQLVHAAQPSALFMRRNRSSWQLNEHSQPDMEQIQQQWRQHLPGREKSKFYCVPNYLKWLL